jgi:Zn finger protein HypA/HybF involved in hydrogenase expression
VISSKPTPEPVVSEPTVEILHSNSMGAEVKCTRCQTVFYTNWTRERDCPGCHKEA